VIAFGRCSAIHLSTKLMPRVLIEHDRAVSTMFPSQRLGPVRLRLDPQPFQVAATDATREALACFPEVQGNRAPD
jgi:hypothetical protein